MVITTALGRLGNQCFQLATGLSYALQNNLEFSAPLNSHPHFINLINPNLDPNLDKIYIPETAFTYEPLEFKEEWRDKNIIIQGYRQSALYFNSYREEIVKLFNFPYEFKKGWCAICVRRGDYLNLQEYHCVVSNIYLQEAQMKIMNEGVGKFLVCSDDIEWTKTCMPQFDNADYMFSEGKTDVEDLSLIASCENVIMSASAFSWWGAYLGRNENRKVIYPSKWFNKRLPHNTKDLCPSTWISL